MKHHLMVLFFTAILCSLWMACDDEVAVSQMDNNKTSSLVQSAMEKYPNLFKDVCIYDEILSKPKWNEYVILKENADTVLVSVPIDYANNKEKWQVILTKTGSNANSEIFVIKIPYNAEDSAKQNHFVVSSFKDKESITYKLDTNTLMLRSDCYRVPISIEDEKIWLVNCPLSGGSLPEVIVTPEGQTYPADWWWIYNIPGLLDVPPVTTPTIPAILPIQKQIKFVTQNATIIGQLKKAWNRMQNLVKSSSRQEVGFWVYYDSATSKYYVGDLKDGPKTETLGGTHGTVLPGKAAPNQNGSQIPITAIPITFVHTHTPITYFSETSYRQVGPSDGDILYAKSQGIQMAVLDFKGTLDPTDGKYYIYGGHSQYLDYEIYYYDGNGIIK